MTQPGRSAVVAPASAAARTRWWGVDAARGLAVLGMMAAHVLPRDELQGELLVDGRPSVLFAVVAGVALGLVTGGPSPHRERAGSARLQLVIRAALLVGLGLLLWMLPSGIAIILDYYGVMFVLVMPFLFLRRRWLAIGAALLLVAMPLVRDAVVDGRWGAVPDSDPAARALDYLLTGYYPALLWLPLLLAGLLIARCDLGATRARVTALSLGVAASLVGYGSAALVPAIDTSAHSGTTAELLGSGGLAVAIIAGLTLVLDRTATPRAVRVLATPFVAIGRIPLTVYTAHVLIIASLAAFGPAGQFESAVGISLFAALTIAAALVGLLCMRMGWRGPLEALFSVVAGLPGRRVAASPAVRQ
ncbi:MAG: DUF1624 domain-containing protein [Microcella sp.]|uniref:heparan-alpha-glucosaminide N-acetyltransferase domain-containing protein n=1 Tax=Microcella sp. TaxID=1913979 RepID=UPI0024CBA166|nr:heparan-alpha-glucosaminide N-acetyltransferase domain-containing protein [Microcella sp.]UYN83925.1 MAG: DUF1624 domain-containing protein [Microcella sp.]